LGSGFHDYIPHAAHGDGKHPLHEALSCPDAPFPGDVKWNFGKFLVDREGKVIARFEPRTKPDSAEVVAAIETALKAGR